MAGLALLPAPLPAGVVGGFTTRYGGVSVGRWSELNLGRSVGDDPAAVEANRRRLADRLGVETIAMPRQVHGAQVAVVSGAHQPEADAVISSTPDVALGILVADCLPVLLADPAAGVIAAVHAGRRGLAAGVLQATVRGMTAAGADPAGITAVIGPGIGGCCYEVGVDVQQAVAVAVPGSAAYTQWGTPSLDLPAGAEGVLHAAGVGRVERLPICTYTDERLYSYRRDGVTGRFAGVVLRRA